MIAARRTRRRTHQPRRWSRRRRPRRLQQPWPRRDRGPWRKVHRHRTRRRRDRVRRTTSCSGRRRQSHWKAGSRDEPSDADAAAAWSLNANAGAESGAATSAEDAGPCAGEVISDDAGRRGYIDGLKSIDTTPHRRKPDGIARPACEARQRRSLVGQPVKTACESRRCCWRKCRLARPQRCSSKPRYPRTADLPQLVRVDRLLRYESQDRGPRRRDRPHRLIGLVTSSVSRRSLDSSR